MERQASTTPTAQKRVIPDIVTAVDEHLDGLRVHTTSIWVPGSTQETQFRAHVKEQCSSKHDLIQFGPGAVTGIPIHNRDLPVYGSTVIGVQVCHPVRAAPVVDADAVGYDSQPQHPAEVLQPGHRRDCPIEISDSDETTLADSTRTDTDSDLTESDGDEFAPRAAAKAQRILDAWHIRHAQLDAGTEWDADNVLHLKMPLLALSRMLDPDEARQQVTARFITELQPSWEARGATMLGECPDYTSAMVDKLQGISRDATEWRSFGDRYTQMLALLQLDSKELHNIWPGTGGGEASFRSMWRHKIKKWSSASRRCSATAASTVGDLVVPLASDADMVRRCNTIQEVKMYWSYLYEAMHSLQSPSVVIAAAEAALRAIATYWDFGETVAMAAVISKCEERLPLTFGSPTMVALGKVVTVMSAGATEAIWRHMKQQQVLATGSSSCISDVTGKYDSMAAASAAWGVHYGKRLQNDCQRRNRLMEDAVLGTAAEITELFAELDITKQHGFEYAAMGVADEAGDVWYGARCYAVAYTEQAQRVLYGWKANMENDTPAGVSAHGCL